MTKARASQRAKSNALKLAKKRAAAAAAAEDQTSNTGRFSAETLAQKSPHGNVNANNFAGAKRGSARSK